METWLQQGKSVLKKWWFWGIVTVVALFVIGLFQASPDTRGIVSVKDSPNQPIKLSAQSAVTTGAEQESADLTWHTAFTYANATEVGIANSNNGGITNSNPFTLKGSRQRVTISCYRISSSIGAKSLITGGVYSHSSGFDDLGDMPCPGKYSYNEYFDPSEYHLSFAFINATSTILVEDYY